MCHTVETKKYGHRMHTKCMQQAKMHMVLQNNCSYYLYKPACMKICTTQRL